MTQSYIPAKTYWGLNLLGTYVFNFERRDILRDSIEHTSKKLLLFEFAQSIQIQFQASRYTMGLNRTFEKKIILVWICSKLPFSILSVRYIMWLTQTSQCKVIGVWIFKELTYSISSVLIYLVKQYNIRVKIYSGLHFLGAFVFNFECLDILRDSVGHSSKKLLSFEFAQSSCFKFRVSWYIMGLNRTFE